MLPRRDAGTPLSLSFLLPHSERGGSCLGSNQAQFIAPAVISRLRRRSSAS